MWNFPQPRGDHAASGRLRRGNPGGRADKYWHDHKGAMVNAIRTRKGSRRPMWSSCALARSTANGTRRLMRAMPRPWASPDRGADARSSACAERGGRRRAGRDRRPGQGRRHPALCADRRACLILRRPPTYGRAAFPISPRAAECCARLARRGGPGSGRDRPRHWKAVPFQHLFARRRNPASPSHGQSRYRQWNSRPRSSRAFKRGVQHAKQTLAFADIAVARAWGLRSRAPANL
jgi:hypothetical protein